MMTNTKKTETTKSVTRICPDLPMAHRLLSAFRYEGAVRVTVKRLLDGCVAVTARF